ncbi:lysine 2,3-aminomutase, partial [Actinomadura rugatobispora]
LHFIQCRDSDLVGKPFFAKYDPEAVWLDDLKPAFADRFPWQGPRTEGSGASRLPVV